MLRYGTTKANRIVITNGRRKLSPAGHFSVDKDNQLNYYLEEQGSWQREFGLKDVLRFKGAWKIARDYDLEYVLDRKGRSAPDTLRLYGRIVSVDKDALIFEAKTFDGAKESFRLLHLSGMWQVDQQNCLTFAADKKGRPDELVFSGAWDIDASQQVVYRYQKTDLATKRKIEQVLLFKGFWHIAERKSLGYCLEGSSRSGFKFKADIGTGNVYPRKGEIKYRMGISGKPKRTVSLYGTWKFSRSLGLVFEMDYAHGKVHALEFTADIDLSRRDCVAFGLVDRSHKPLGLTVVFTHRFLKELDAEAYLKIRSLLDNGMFFETGARIPF